MPAGSGLCIWASCAQAGACRSCGWQKVFDGTLLPQPLLTAVCQPWQMHLQVCGSRPCQTVAAPTADRMPQSALS